MRKSMMLVAVALLAAASTSAYAAPRTMAKGLPMASRSASGLGGLPTLSSRAGMTRTVTFRTSSGGLLPGLTTVLLSQDGLLNPDKAIGKLILGHDSLIPNGIPLLGGPLGASFGGFLVYVGSLPGLGRVVANL